MRRPWLRRAFCQPARAQSLLLLEMLQVCGTACTLHYMTGAQIMPAPQPPDDLYVSCLLDAFA